MTAQYNWLRTDNPGATCIFTGLVRQMHPADQSKQSTIYQALTLEHYPGMTESRLASFVDSAQQRWHLLAVALIHRYGTLLPKEQIVLVGVASAHRADAFSACEYIMDYLKTDAPFWKKEIYGHQSHWISTRKTDFDRRDRWR